MMIITLAAPGWSTEFVVDADPATSVGDILKLALDSLDPSQMPHGDGPGMDGVYLDDRPLDLSESLAASGIRNGAVVRLGQPGPARRAGGLVTVRAVAGVGAGQV